MQDQPNTNSDSPPSGVEADQPTASYMVLPALPDDHLLEAVTEPEANTLYVLPGDVLLIPCGDGIPSAVSESMKEVHDYLGLTEMIVTSGVGAPWILRKATVAGESL